MRAALIPIVLAAGCAHVVSKPNKEPDVSAWATWDPATQTGQRPVTVGTELGVMVNWHGWCEYTRDPVPGGGNNDYPCDFVDHEVSIDCGGACRLAKTEHSYAYRIIPTRVGELRATLTVRGRGVAKQFALDPVQVVLPTAAKVRCFPPSAALPEDDRHSFEVSLYHGDDYLMESHPTAVRVVGGPACEGGEWFRCRVDATRPVELEITGDGYVVKATADCGSGSARI